MLSNVRQKFEEKSKQHQKLVEKQRAYFKAVKDFQVACDKNEMLEEQLEELMGWAHVEIRKLLFGHPVAVGITYSYVFILFTFLFGIEIAYYFHRYPRRTSAHGYHASKS